MDQYTNANMALAATELGVGACHIWGAVGTLNASNELKALLNIPKGMTPCCAIALGHFGGKYEIREIAPNRITTNYMK